MSNSYQEEVKIKNTLRLRELQKELPSFMIEFFRGLSDITSSRTRIGYSYDLKIFFTYLCQNISKFKNVHPCGFTLEHLSQVDADDIELFIEYLTYYTKDVDGQEFDITNDAHGKERKLSAVRTLFSYFYKKRKITSNPAKLVDFPIIHHKAIVRLEIDEIAKLLDEVESGEKLTERQKKFHGHLMKRDLAIVTLLLGTGMRISECVGIDLEHLDFNMSCVKVVRKGGDEAILYFSDEVTEALRNYFDDRIKITTKDGHENAFFLSQQNRRLTDRAIQILVKKYSRLVTTLKKITPHKLRSTFGTNMYRETGDIYLVADLLGHADVNTTKKHYAQMDEERRRSASKLVKLRQK